MNKRGISEIITTVVMVALALVAIGVVWVVISNILEQSKEDISSGLSRVALDIESVALSDDKKSLNVKIERDVGKGDLSKIKFLLSDGETTISEEQTTTMQELDKNTFPVSLKELVYVKDVSVAPVLKTESGKEKLMDITDKYEVVENNVDVVKLFFSPVSWWRMEGNANDEVGDSDGTVGTGTFNYVEGKYGSALNTPTASDYLLIPLDSEFGSGGSYSISFLVKPNQLSSATFPFITRGSPYIRIFASSSSLEYDKLGGEVEIGNIRTTSALTMNQWAHITTTYDKPSTFSAIYFDGIGEKNSTTADMAVNPQQANLGGGVQIDEVMIFNRALSENEVKALYELDLNK